MFNFSWAAAAMMLLAAGSAGAQTAKPETAVEAAAAAASAAMERAMRQAAGPMRVILEASKSRRKNTEPDAPVLPPADSGSVRPVSSRSASPAVAAPEPVTRALAAARSAVAAATPAPTPAPAVAVAVAGTVAPLVAPEPPVATASAAPVSKGAVAQLTLSSEALQGKGDSALVPALEAVGAAPAAALLPAGAMTQSNPSVGPAKVKLINRVDPEVAQRHLDDMGRNAVVTVDLTIRADGSVGAVTVLPPSPRGIQRALVDALEQWRFEPLSSQRLHRVQLIFNPEP